MFLWIFACISAIPVFLSSWHCEGNRVELGRTGQRRLGLYQMSIGWSGGTQEACIPQAVQALGKAGMEIVLEIKEHPQNFCRGSHAHFIS